LSRTYFQEKAIEEAIATPEKAIAPAETENATPTQATTKYTPNQIGKCRL